MRRLLVSCLGIIALSLAVQAGPKEDFIDAVKNQCKKDDATAEKLATPGREGTVIQFKLCGTPTIDAGEGCALACSKSGSTIGN